MCTTYLALEIINNFKEMDLIEFPRLVRLNPNIPWKTRGNASLCLKFGIGKGEKYLIGKLKNTEIFAYKEGKSIKFEKIKNLENRIKKIIESNAHLDCENTNSAYVITNKKFSNSLYWNAVREIIDLNEIKNYLKNSSSIYKGYNNERGLIGATAAIAWKPIDKTYEIIAYREKKHWGSKRIVDENSIIEMDKKYTNTFDNYDYFNKIPVIIPGSPCPVLFGIRSSISDLLIDALNSIKSEIIDRWLIFETNQATDNHLQKKTISTVNEYESVIVTGKIINKPKTIIGGHVFFRISDGNEMDCAAYEPTKQFRNIIRELQIGDIVTVYGGVHQKPFTLNIEKIRIENLTKIYNKVENPICKCGKRMKSIGKGKGYRCKSCGKKVNEDSIKKEILERNLNPCFYEVPPVARRHISKPLKFMDDKYL